MSTFDLHSVSKRHNLFRPFIYIDRYTNPIDVFCCYFTLGKYYLFVNCILL